MIDEPTLKILTAYWHPVAKSGAIDNSMTSDLVLTKKSILFSNNKNEFYSLDIKTGTLIWQNKINSTVRPSVADNLVFTITEENKVTFLIYLIIK